MGEGAAQPAVTWGRASQYQQLHGGKLRPTRSSTGESVSLPAVTQGELGPTHSSTGESTSTPADAAPRGRAFLCPQLHGGEIAQPAVPRGRALLYQLLHGGSFAQLARPLGRAFQYQQLNGGQLEHFSYTREVVAIYISSYTGESPARPTQLHVGERFDTSIYVAQRFAKTTVQQAFL